MGQGHLSVSHHMDQKPSEEHGSSRWLPAPHPNVSSISRLTTRHILCPEG